MSTAYLTQAAGKMFIALNLDLSSGKEVMRRLLKSADILVENHKPETMARLGLDETSVRRLNPRLIHCSLTGYGRSGDRENAPTYDVIRPFHKRIPPPRPAKIFVFASRTSAPIPGN